MLKDIKQLPKDFRKLVTEARAEALQNTTVINEPKSVLDRNFNHGLLVKLKCKPVKPRQGQFIPEDDALPRLKAYI